ncbi:TonB-dependent siderophore receptor [Novosphingobium resinovorum]|uniref:TonB-dependent siderophore receptor n=2 Tax=Novosphingobium resinovorum TaxID=158500 RepID=A0A031JQR3_9SPHN|nr:TonB-dependent siderophore receptor [Novosphingobium resinovorum]
MRLNYFNGAQSHIAGRYTLAAPRIHALSSNAFHRMGLAAASITALLPIAAAAQAADENAPVRADEIVVTADRRDTFSADYVQAGTFRDSLLRDTPLTIAVMTKDLLEAQQARGLIDAVRNTPGVTQAQINTAIYSNLAIRGIVLNNFTNVRWNGVLPIVNLIEQPIESKDRIEVLKGAAGLYYGFATPSGIVNLVTERPNAAPVTRFDVQGDSNGSVGAGFDIGRSFGAAGLRVNAGTSIIETGLKRSEGIRRFASGSFDWRPADGLEILLDAEYNYKSVTEPTEFSLPAAVNGVIAIPPLQSPSKNLGAAWMQGRGWETNLLARMNYDLTPDWRISAAIGQSYLTRGRAYSSFGGYNLATGDGTVTVAMTDGNDYRNVIYRGDLSGKFRTGPIEHNLLLGVSFYTRDSNVPTAVRYSFAQNLYDPVVIPRQPTPPRIIANPSRVEDLGLYIFDRASLGDWLQATVGYRKTDYSDVSRTTSYKIKPGTWTYGVMVKPISWANIYANYIEGLEPGPIAQQIANNAGEILPAAISKQKEVGIKIEPLRGLLATGAYFHIKRPSAYLNSANVFVQDAEAAYEGAEFSLVGEVVPNLSIAASAMYLDAMQKSGNATVVGKLIENVSKYSGSLFLEYRVPVVEGLRVSAGMFHVGRRAVNALNQGFVPGYETFDLGASYTFDLLGNRTTARIYGENITGKRYWASTGSSLLAQGLPATVKLSISTQFP